MATISEDYVSFETAKLLKEKGFDEETEYIYSNNGELLRLNHFGIKDLTNTDCNGYHTWQFPIEGVASIISAPTLQMAMKWLREVYNIFIDASIFKDSSEDADGNVVDEWVFYSYDIYASLDGHLIYSFDDGQYDTYEEACEAAIKYCLENLI